MTIMQGDSYPIYFDLKQDGKVLTPVMVAEMEVCVGEGFSKLYSEGGVMFDEESRQWYIHPSQTETMALDVNTHSVIARIRYNGTTPEEVIGVKIGWIEVTDSISEAVI